MGQKGEGYPTQSPTKPKFKQNRQYLGQKSLRMEHKCFEFFNPCSKQATKFKVKQDQEQGDQIQVISDNLKTETTTVHIDVLRFVLGNYIILEKIVNSMGLESFIPED